MSTSFMMAVGYNALLLLLDGVLLATIRSRPSWLRFWIALLLVEGAGLVMGLMLPPILGFHFFAIIRLWAWCTFLHTWLLLAGTAVLARKHTPGLWRTTALGALLLPLVAADAFLLEPHWLAITHHEIHDARLSQRVRVAVLADLQAEEIGDYERRVLNALGAAQPDLLVVPGDLLQPWSVEEFNAMIPAFQAAWHAAGIAPPLGTWVTGGDVDPAGGLARLFAGTGATVVEQSTTIELAPLTLTALSNRDSYSEQPPIPASPRFHMVMGHRPDYALAAPPADLLVAGHTHGGQIRLPWLGPVLTLSRVPRAWAAGFVALPNGGSLLVSRGIGMERHEAPRFRFLCRPELVLLDLLPAD